MAAKRLIKELDQYNKDPSPAVLRLEPTSDDDLFHLTAVLRGPDSTAYEGEILSFTCLVLSSPPIHLQLQKKKTDVSKY